ncbi:fluoride efflux transporter CrcB [Nonomuraea sp. NPDC059194]|uniref:fluoride efflux transporter CrcB n=1 Tax=Nonomuraea sp. NPDC059194 TaxID=3346764 RepID=UPI0036C9133E
MKEPIDPDLGDPDLGDEAGPPRWRVLAAIAVGGMAGALARYGLGVAFPHAAGAFPWATFVTNVVGCLLIGILMVVITERPGAHPLARPLLGVGVLGGFTTFSTYVVDAQRLLASGAAVMALVYLAATVLVALAAVLAGIRLARAALR